MSRVYFDSNVFSSMRSSASQLYEQLNKSLLPEYKSNLTFVFSPAHIRDKKKDFSDKKFLDFAFIESLTCDNHISYHALEKRPNFYLATPLMVYNDQSENDKLDSVLDVFKEDPSAPPSLNKSFKLLRSVLDMPLPLDLKLSDVQSPQQKEFLSRIVPLDKPNPTLLEVVERQMLFYNDLMSGSQVYKDLRKIVDEGINNGKYLLKNDFDLDFNEALKDSILEKSFIDFVKDSTRKDNNGQSEYYDFYLQAYYSLDMLGIKKDKLNEKNTFANLFNDALHSYYARYCDFFVTADDTLRSKSKAIYSLFKCDTKVLSVEEFISGLPEFANTTDKSLYIFFEKLSKDIRDAERAETHTDEDGRQQTILWTSNKYFNFFDCVFEVKENGHAHYFLRKQQHHLLSRPNFREQGAILDRCVKIFGIDIQGKGAFSFDQEVEEIRDNRWTGRLWRIGTLVISLIHHPGLKEFCVVVSPLDSLNGETNKSI